MKATINGVRIRGICATVPAETHRFVDEIKYFPFPEKSSLRLGRVMGFKEHRIADAATSPCDLASYTLNHIFNKKYLSREKLEGMLVVAQMADHICPGNSKVIHGQLDLPRSTYCNDIYENCIGFITGLYTAATQIAAGAAQELAVVVTDGGACRANKLDRNTYPLCGDAAGVAIVCKSDNPEDKLHFVFKNDGSKRDALIVPAGGCRMPATPETARAVKDEMGNIRSLNDMHMDGTAVFQFVMDQVPALVEEACAYAGVSRDEVEWHLTHQPNRFMLEKLADLMKVPRSRLFNNIVENFGNSSSATIPVNIAFNLGEKLKTENPLVCLSSFGAGLSLAACVGHLGNLDFCELIEHPGHGAISEHVN